MLRYMDFFSGVRVDAIVNFSMLAGRLLSCSSFIVRGVTRIPPSASSTHLCVQTTTRLLNASARMRVSERQPWSSRDFVRRRAEKLRITMTEEQKAQKLTKIEHQQSEELPSGLVAKLKFYIKRYWYIAIPVHSANCAVWFAILYVIVRTGIDVTALLEMLHLPASIIQKVKDAPPTANQLVVTFILYKLALPLRYATTIFLIRIAFNLLRKTNFLRTAREVEFKVRSKFEDLNKRRLAVASKLTARLKPVKRQLLRQSQNGGAKHTPTSSHKNK